MSRITRQEAENAALIDAMAAMNDPVARELANRVTRCRADRLARRSLGRRPTTEEALRAGPQFKCKTPACWACAKPHVLGKKRQALALFGDASNEECSFMTINAAEPCTDFDDVTTMHRKFTDDIDNWFRALARGDRRFARVRAYAVLELAHDGSMWKPHWHIVVRHDGIDRQEIAKEARRRWRGARRVQVKKFKVENTVTENIQKCIGYSFKFDHRGWSAYTSAQLFVWIRKGAALRSMTKIIGPRGARRIAPTAIGAVDPSLDESDVSGAPLRDPYDEPMPMLFGDEFTLECGHHSN